MSKAFCLVLDQLSAHRNKAGLLIKSNGNAEILQKRAKMTNTVEVNKNDWVESFESEYLKPAEDPFIMHFTATLPEHIAWVKKGHTTLIAEEKNPEIPGEKHPKIPDETPRDSPGETQDSPGRPPALDPPSEPFPDPNTPPKRK